MSPTLTKLKALFLPAAALTLSAAGLAAGSGASQGTGAEAEPLTCEIAVTKGRYGHTYEGRITARRSVHGTYELSITKRGGGGNAMISQSGEFHVAAGKSDSLGQATFGGLPPDAVNAELTLNWNGKTLFCTNHTDL
jgi:hypothetical protein